jgi:hypothetical protein
MLTMNQPIDWSAVLETSTGAPARLVSGPDYLGNFTVEGDFGRGVERRYCSDNGVDVSSVARFVRPVALSRASAALSRASAARCGAAWPGHPVTMPPVAMGTLARRCVAPKASRSIPVQW